MKLPPKMKSYDEIYKDAYTSQEPWPARDYRFKTYQGLPPDGEPGFYFGFDAEHRPWILNWRPDIAGGCWGAMGYAWNDNHQFDMPEFRLCIDNYKDFIKEWAFSPVCEDIAPKLDAEELADVHHTRGDWISTPVQLKHSWMEWGNTT
jgi:hypothetical protein